MTTIRKKVGKKTLTKRRVKPGEIVGIEPDAETPTELRTAADRRKRKQQYEELAMVANEQGDIAKTASERASEARAALLKMMKEDGYEGTVDSKNNALKFDGPEGGRYTVTIIEPSRLIIDPEKLRKKVGAALWSRVTDRVLNKSKLEGLVAAQQIDGTVIAQCSSEEPGTPYVKVTRRG